MRKSGTASDACDSTDAISLLVAGENLRGISNLELRHEKFGLQVVCWVKKGDEILAFVMGISS